MSARWDIQPRTRDLQPDDVERVIAVERAIYEFPWTPGNFQDAITAGYHALLLELDRHLIGYRIMMTGAGEAHLLNLSIATDWQRRGYGRLLLLASIRDARQAGATAMFLEVRPSNDAGLALYNQTGFRRVGMRKRYYPATVGREDAWVMSLPL